MIFNNEKLSQLKNYKLWFGIFLAAGILFRLYHFFYNRSLWMDEVYLSSSLIRMDYWELITKQLDYQQKAPIGFLLVVKFFVNLFGTNEMALRLFSLISGIISMFLFIPVARYFCGKRGALWSLGILAFAPPLIFHAVEIKQYQTELLATLLMLYFYIKYQNSSSYLHLLWWAFTGAVILWFSYAVIFVLAGLAAGLTIYRIIKKDWVILFKQAIPFSVWFLSFGINYLLFTHRHAESKWIVYWFDYYHTFMPVFPKSVQDLKWYPVNLYRMMDYPLGLQWNFYQGSSAIIRLFFKLSVLPSLFFLFSGLLLFYKKKQDFLVICFLFFFLFIASGLKLYPLTERFWVFISPVLILSVANGMVWGAKLLSGRAVAVLIPVFILGGVFFNSTRFVRQPDEFLTHKRSFQREALDLINAQVRPTDVVYVYWNDMPGFRFYKNTHSLSFTAIEGKDYRNVSSSYEDYLHHLETDFKCFKGKQRIWFIYNDYYRTDIGDQIDQPAWYYQKNMDPTKKILTKLSTLGEEKEVFSSFDVKVSVITQTIK